MAIYVKCPICDQKFDRLTTDFEYIGGRYYHVSCCSEDFLYREKIHIFLRELWGASIYSRVKINNQINAMVKKHGYTIKQIYQDLFYFYEVKKNDSTKYQNTIQIVPYIHKEGQQHFNLAAQKEARRLQLEEDIRNNETQNKIFYVNKQSKRNLLLFELETEEG